MLWVFTGVLRRSRLRRPGSRRSRPRRSRLRRNRPGQRRAVAHQHRGGQLVVLRLAQQVRCHIGGVRRSVGQHQYLAGACDHVDVHDAVYPALGGGHKNVSRADDFIHLRHAFGPVGQRRHGLRAAHFVNGRHARHPCGRKNGRRHTAVLCGRRYHYDLRNARQTRRNSVHQNAGGVAGRAAGHIQAHPLNGRHLLAQHHAGRVVDDKIPADLPFVEGLDVASGHRQRPDEFRVRRFVGRVDIRLRHAQPRQLHTVEFFAITQHRRVSVFLHIGQNIRHRVLHGLRAAGFSPV